MSCHLHKHKASSTILIILWKEKWRGVTCVALVCFCCWSNSAKAQIRGDRELLPLVASQNRANRERIQTWRGKVNITQTNKSLKKRSEVTTKRQVEFAYDRQAKKYMFVATQTEGQGVENGKPVTARPMVWGAIRTPDGYYTMPEWFLDGKKGSTRRPELLLHPLSAESPGEYSPDFDPFWYMSIYGENVNDRLMGIYQHAASKSTSDISVSRSNQQITVLLKASKVGVNRYVFELDQGANLIELSGEDALVKANHKREFVQVSEIWVPKSATSRTDTGNSAEINERSLTWIENVVNEPIPPETFLPERLGIRPNDLVQDTRSGVAYRYDVSNLPEELKPKSSTRAIVLVASLLVGTGLILIVGWRLRKKLMKRHS